MKQIRTTKRRRQWAEARGAVIKGSPLTYPAAARSRYAEALESLVQRMRRDYERELGKLWREHPELAQDANPGSAARILLNSLARKWQRIFSREARRITDRMMRQVDRSSKSNLGKSLKQLSGGITIPTPDMPEAMRAVISASVAENVALITDVGDQFRQRVESAVYSSIQTGGSGRAEIFEHLRHIEGMAERRARFIARDQTAKITAAYNAERAKSVGVRKFEWRHSGGGVEPRELHVRYDGQIFEYDNPPVIDERTGERGLPGQIYNCRCVAIPVIDFGGEDLTP